MNLKKKFKTVKYGNLQHNTIHGTGIFTLDFVDSYGKCR